MPLREAIHGWMAETELDWLAGRASEAERIIEVGVWRGRSTKVLAAATRGRVWAVDHWRGVPDDASQQKPLYRDADEQGDRVFAEFCANLATEIEEGRVVPVRMDSRAAAVHLLEVEGPVFDFIFIDADHRTEAVLSDIAAFRPLLAPGGLLAGHDIDWPRVRAAVDQALPEAQYGARIWSLVP